jgi:LPS export ABC transporter protein LptC
VSISNLLKYMAVAILLQACSNNMQQVNTLVDKSLLDSENADSVQLYYSTNGQIRAILYALKFTHATSSKPSYIEMQKGLKVHFYNGDTMPTSTLTAKRGKYFEDKNNVLVKDSVVVVNVKNERLETEELVWNDQKQIFYTEKFVTITTPTQIIYGDGMEANQDFTYYKILNPKGVFAVNKNKLQ